MGWEVQVLEIRITKKREDDGGVKRKLQERMIEYLVHTTRGQLC